MNQVRKELNVSVHFSLTVVGKLFNTKDLRTTTHFLVYVSPFILDVSSYNTFLQFLSVALLITRTTSCEILSTLFRFRQHFLNANMRGTQVICSARRTQSVTFNSEWNCSVMQKVQAIYELNTQRHSYVTLCLGRHQQTSLHPR